MIILKLFVRWGGEWVGSEGKFSYRLSCDEMFLDDAF